MEEIRRHGKERRQKVDCQKVDHRSPGERRELLVVSAQTRQRLMEMLIFDNMTIQEIIKIVAICAKKEISAKTTIYGKGEQSNEMLILVKGKIAVISGGGVDLQTYIPYDTVGEMGIFTMAPRSATVTALSDCIVLKINKIELFRILDNNPELKEKFQINVIKVISDKVRRQNEIIEEQTFQIRRLEIT